MVKSRIAAILLLLAVQSLLVQADLPVHCVRSQITGKWLLREGKILASNNNKPVSCGHEIPDKAESSNSAMGGVLTEVEREHEVFLDEDFTVRGKEGNGRWTLVYDEGWEIEYNGVKYTHFFKYAKDSSGEYKSVCSQTLVGWFNHIQKKSRGCSQAIKADAVQEFSDNVQQAHVVQPKENQYIFSEISSTMNKLNSQQQQQKSQKINASNSLKRLKLSSKSKFHQSIYLKPHENVFAQMKQTPGTLLNHQEIVKRLNSIKGSSWSAKVPSFLSTMSLEQMNTRAGLRMNKPKYSYDNKQGSFIQKRSSSSSLRGNKATTDYAHYSMESLSDLPKSFDWAEYIHAPRSQEDCGSCYAIATTSMLSSRLWIKYGDNTKLSPQHSLACNYYNQGCDGGYGFLVSKFYSEFEAVPESCHPYEARDGQCNHCNVESLNAVFTVTDYEYIGGSYGKSTERLMMEEIHKNGPIVVSFEPKMDFMYYNKGIYHSVDANQWIQNNEENPVWQKVDHSVLCYGWGEDENGKYWLLQNSWGEEWGESGNFRMRRGTDESNIESMGERANIVKTARKSANTIEFTQTYSSHSDKYFVEKSKNSPKKQ
ncbi:hypothetical protein ABPG72_007470 [Tetrahymena utriculariae]